MKRCRATVYRQCLATVYIRSIYSTRCATWSTGVYKALRAPSTTAIFNRNRDFQHQPRQISRVWAPATATTTMTCRSLLRLLLIRIFWYLVGDLVIRGEVRHCFYQRTEKDWTDRSLRVWVDHQQQPQPRSGCTSRLRLKSLSWMGSFRLKIGSWKKWCIQLIFEGLRFAILEWN